MSASLRARLLNLLVVTFVLVANAAFAQEPAPRSARPQKSQRRSSRSR